MQRGSRCLRQWTSRVNREIQARICEGLRVKLPGSTRSGLLGIPARQARVPATVGLPSAADAPLQRSELAKSANFCPEQVQHSTLGVYRCRHFETNVLAVRRLTISSN